MGDIVEIQHLDVMGTIVVYGTNPWQYNWTVH